MRRVDSEKSVITQRRAQRRKNMKGKRKKKKWVVMAIGVTLTHDMQDE